MGSLHEKLTAETAGGVANGEGGDPVRAEEAGAGDWADRDTGLAPHAGPSRLISNPTASGPVSVAARRDFTMATGRPWSRSGY